MVPNLFFGVYIYLILKVLTSVEKYHNMGQHHFDFEEKSVHWLLRFHDFKTIERTISANLCFSYKNQKKNAGLLVCYVRHTLYLHKTLQRHLNIKMVEGQITNVFQFWKNSCKNIKKLTYIETS